VKKVSLTSSRKLPVLPKNLPVSLKLEGTLAFADYQLVDFTRCPRSFFYGTIMRAGGRRSQTPFLQMHSAVRSVMNSVLAGDSGDLGDLLEKEFVASGLSQHGYAADYRAFALPMLEYFRDIRAGRKSIKTDPLVFQIGSETIIVTPHEILEDGRGRRVLRSIRTGSRRSHSHDDLAAAALLLAATKAFPATAVELVFLNDRECLPLSLTKRVLENRSDEMTDFFDAVKRGNFPTTPGDGCARCSSLFYCGALPAGHLAKKL
jgi:hypothetical protein